MTARAARLMRGMLDRGFTTVRDTGGADWGIKTAVEQGLIPGPAPVHRRPRDRPDRRPQRPAPAHRLRRALPLLQRHGVHAWRSPTASTRCARRAREQMRQGADQVKIMMSGGVASPYDPLDIAAVQPGRDRRRRRGGAGLRPLRLRPRLHAGGDHPRRPCRRAHHRARQPDRRAGRQADGREGRVPGRQPRHLLRHEASAPPSSA